MHQPMHTLYSSRTADKFVVRLPDGMRERVGDAARKHHRSMNSEIISRLEASLRDSEEFKFSDADTTQISPQEWSLIETFRSLAPHQRSALIEILAIGMPDREMAKAANS